MACAALPAHIDVRAATIDLYLTEPPLLAARGGVALAFGQAHLRADAARYDLRHNRIVASGGVALSDGLIVLHAAACALDVASGDGVLLRLDGALPATYAFRLGGAVSTTAGAPQPQAFDVAPTDGLRPFVYARHAIVTPNANVRFTKAHVSTEAGVALPSPSYLYTFSTNPSFAQSSMPATSFDQPYGLAGNADAQLAAHLRYDTNAGRPTLGIDGHLVDGSRSYLIASALPTTAGILYDLAGYRQITPLLGATLSASAQPGFAGGAFQLQHSERETTTTLILQQTGGYQSGDLRLSTLGHEIPRFGYYKFALDAGYDHQPGAQPSAWDTRASLEGDYTTPNLRGPFGTTLSSSVDVATTLFNFPRERGSSRVYGSIARRVGRALSLFGSVQFLQTFDRYRTDEAAYYPTTPPILPNGLPYYGYSAFAGVATYRTYALQATYSPNPSFNLILDATRERDWPQYDGYGAPPEALGFDVRVRAPNGPTIEVGRTFIFGWGGRQWSPAYTLSIAP
jgi:hypothetical protein